MDDWMQRLTQYGARLDGALERLGGDRDGYLGCLRKMLREQSFQNLETALCEMDTDGAFLWAHRIKGSAAMLGLVPMVVSVSPLVESLRQHQMPDAFQPQLDTLMRQRDDLLAMLPEA